MSTQPKKITRRKNKYYKNSKPRSGKKVELTYTKILSNEERLFQISLLLEVSNSFLQSTT